MILGSVILSKSNLSVYHVVGMFGKTDLINDLAKKV